MTRLNLSRISPEKKKDMYNVLHQWKQNGSSVKVLKEGLMLLSQKDRPTAWEVSETLSNEMAGVFCTYGKGNRPKAALDRNSAAMLLEIVSGLSDKIPFEEAVTTALGMAASVLLNGTVPPNGTVAHSLWKPVLDVLGKFDPQVNQTTMLL